MLWVDRDHTLLGEDAQSFFNPVSVLEVYISSILTEKELAAYYLHLADLRQRGVHFVGSREEAGGTVFRFQALSYELIYNIMHQLMAPFRMSRAIDWRQTLASLPTEEQAEVVSVVARLQLHDARGRWLLAERMAEVLGSYRNARIYRMQIGRNRGVRVDVSTNQEIADRLAREGLPEPVDQTLPMQIITGNNASITMKSKSHKNIRKTRRTAVTESYDIGDVTGSTVGRGGRAEVHDIVVYKQIVDNAKMIDVETKQVLKKARDTLEKENLSEVDKGDAADHLGKLTKELENADAKDEGRIRRLFGYIKDVAPDVASVLTTAVSLAKMVAGSETI
jgi:hypothetical protein